MAVPVLVAAMQKDENASVREYAAQQLGEFGESLDVPLVSAALVDPSPAVRSGAAQALGKLGGEAARQALRDALEREKKEKVKQSIRWAIAAIDTRPVKRRARPATPRGGRVGHPIEPPRALEEDVF